MFDHLIAFARLLKEEKRNRREMRDLLERDDRMLEDIGVTRDDIRRGLSKPIGLCAMCEEDRLARRAIRRDGARLETAC